MAFTFFFRDSYTLELAIRLMAPEARGRSRIRVWDAGCAMGPEPYTLAILLAEGLGRYSIRNVLIDATDLDAETGDFGDTVNRAVYPFEMLQRIPKELFARYFESAGTEGMFAVKEEIRSRIRYRQHDLLSLRPVGTGFTMIVCKNVLLHFTHEQRVQVIRMFHESLMPGGFLVMEQTQKMPSEMGEWFDPLARDAQVFRRIDSTGQETVTPLNQEASMSHCNGS